MPGFFIFEVIKMYCVIAAEMGAAEIIVSNLQKIYPDWQFESCTDTKTLMHYIQDRPDVMVVSRFLPGDDPLTVLRNVPQAFTTSHIVLLVGVLNEQARAYIRAAKKLGLENIVTGKLPGDRPYTLLAALTHHLIELEEALDEPPEEDAEESKPVLLPVLALEQRARPERKIFLPKIKHLPKLKNQNHSFFTTRKGTGHGGTFILVSANKGGVGKTTVAITLAVALAKAEIPVVLTDFDLSGPDVATFFNIKNVPGIERLAGGREQPASLLAKIKENLFILPGPMDKTMPHFEPGTLVSIVDDLLAEFPVVIADTPPGFWEKRWLEEIFERADMVVSVVDQSKFSEKETQDYAPRLLLMGVKPENIRIVLNKHSAKLHNVKIIEKNFCLGFKKGVKHLPKVIATIPENWNTHVLGGYKGEVVGLDEDYSQWHRLAGEVAQLAGYRYTPPEGKPKKSFFSRWIRP